MDSLPEEIITTITSFLPSRGLAPLATLSRSWQRAIERRTFATLRISSVDEDLDAFTRIVSSVLRRRASLHYLSYQVVIPFDSSGTKSSKQNQQQQQARINEAFSLAIAKLFHILAAAENGGDTTGYYGGGAMTLQLDTLATTRHDPERPAPQPVRPRIILPQEGRTLPLVRSITALFLTIDVSQPYRASLRTAIDLARRLPRLQRLGVDAAECETCDAGPGAVAAHVGDRIGLADALRSARFPPGSRVGLSLEDHDPTWLAARRGRRWAPPDYAGGLPRDPLGAALRDWARGLVALEVGGVFDGSLFWPGEHEHEHDHELATTTTPSPWARLREFHARLGMTTPSGEWYFGRSTNAKPLNVPRDETLQPLFARWAEGLARMPVLEQASITFIVDVDLGAGAGTSVEKWAIAFQGPGTRPDPVRHPWRDNLAEDDFDRPRLVFQNTGTWRPWEPTIKKLRELAADRFPGRMMVELVADPYNEVTRI